MSEEDIGRFAVDGYGRTLGTSGVRARIGAEYRWGRLDRGVRGPEPVHDSPSALPALAQFPRRVSK